MKSKKLEIMKTRPHISDEEIDAMMDFDKVLSKYHSIKKYNKSAWVWGAGTVVLVVSSLMLFKPTPQVQQPALPKADPPILAPKKKEESTPTEEQKSKSVKPLSRKQSIQQSTRPVEPADVYTEAEPLHGYEDLYTYFQNELSYPTEALKDSIEGVVSVSFVINKDGKPEQIKILNSPGVVFDKEAIRVVSGMPEWKPASLNGKLVPARISMPITFQSKQR
jgi:TonB family protein